MAACRHVHPYGAMSAVWMYLVSRGKTGEERRRARTGSHTGGGVWSSVGAVLVEENCCMLWYSCSYEP